MNALDWIALVLVVIGGINWGLVALWNFDVVALIFGSIPMLAVLIYVLIAIAAIYMFIMALKKHR